jgi:conjugative relaxase-like TrwC/TraI family protein
VLTITKLNGAEYLISSVADGMEDYYMGAGEAPGVWRGGWAVALGLEGVVEADALRALVDGHDPTTGEDLLAGLRERTVRAIDVTLSVPKSVSLLWAFGTPETSAAVSIAVVEATETALAFLEERAAVARQQQGGIRRRVATHGFAIATFAHRTSRAGDPQLHTHCLIPNVVQRDDGRFVAFDANPLHTWAKATGTVFLNELERLLTRRLGIEWGPERNGCREMVGFTRDQLRAFSKRTAAIETRLEAEGEVAFPTKRERMRADDRASLATRERKDKTLTPERLRDRWKIEAGAVGLEPGPKVDDRVVGRQLAPVPMLDDAALFAALVDPETGLCATESRFCEAHVVERVAALTGGRLTTDEIVERSRVFLALDLVVRLAPGSDRRRPPEWSTVEHRALEDRLLTHLHQLTATRSAALHDRLVDAAITAAARPLGDDQAGAVHVLCGNGAGARLVVAPAGFGKTTTLHAAVSAQHHAGRRTVVLAPTHKAVGELQAAGLDAQTVARFLTHQQDELIRAGTTVIVDETSQLGTRHAAALLELIAHAPGAQLWCVGDSHQAQAIAASGFLHELERLAAREAIPAATLHLNRRQLDPAEQEALARLRAGDVDTSQQIRSAHGWEHEHATPAETRDALAHAAVADADRYGVDQVAVLAVSHADCEDLADRIRALRSARGELRGPTLRGPGWRLEPRIYAAGDRILIHTNRAPRAADGVSNGSTGTILTVDRTGATMLLDDRRRVFLPVEAIRGSRPDGTPNVSHAWARTVDGAQGGTWHQVHLLGTPTLDRHTGYVGQSRGRLPTHTWNTRPEPDHPKHLLADQRGPSEVVADALRRAGPKTFAVHDDPWTVDRVLRAERDQHAAIVATRPPDLRTDLDQARVELERATNEHTRAGESLAHYEAERARLGRLTRLRRGGRDDIIRADQSLAGAHRRLTRASEELNAARAQVTHNEAAVAARSAWDREHRWRLERIRDLDDRLAHHWVDVVLRAVRADDPLAFGIERLREARATYHHDLQRAAARDDRAVAEANPPGSHPRTGYPSEPDLPVRLEAGVRDLDAALEHTRPHRVAAAATDPTHPLWHMLGPPPLTRGGLAAWCGIAERVETANDHMPSVQHTDQDATPHLVIDARRRIRNQLQGNQHEDVVNNARAIIDIASRYDPTPEGHPLDERDAWQPTLDTAGRAFRIRHPEIRRGVGLEP